MYEIGKVLYVWEFLALQRLMDRDSLRCCEVGRRPLHARALQVVVTAIRTAMQMKWPRPTDVPAAAAAAAAVVAVAVAVAAPRATGMTLTNTRRHPRRPPGSRGYEAYKLFSYI